MTAWPYPPEWYAEHRGPDLAGAARSVGRSVAEILPLARNVVDVGCGVGTVLEGLHAEYLRIHGSPPVLLGVEHPSALAIILDRGFWACGEFADVVGIDLETPLATLPLDARWDVAVCLETAEHISDPAGAQLVKELCRVASTVVWSAAIPGQGGEIHINERPLVYWQERFEREGFDLDLPKTEALQVRIAPHIRGAPWYERIRIYRRGG